ncbi:hypothetical protein C4K19_3731 [Pseudomonas chlororaphis subsp. aurantiaca]|uniref:hypothetical protein n=1 Tax=Pseudomonas chlororaphis TaxID=587753 RepID=UPI000F586655|nr:hypothetical protein [Pseudomonas chlororaphis]AZD55516.1 hypothetical protein C4K19_3731 [Pseudomonas chlororaphis subsp. aurantiaca]
MALTADTIEVIQEPRLTSADGQADDSGRFPLKVLITLDVTSQATADAYVCSLEMLTQAFQAQLRPVSEDTISMPKRPIPSTLLRKAKMLAKAKTEILQSNDWVTASEISDLAQFKSNNPGSQPNKWKLAGKIFALRHEAIDYFPIYGLDPAQGYRPFSGLKPIVSTLSSMKDGWGMAFWFASPNSYLGGKRPKDVLQANPEGVLDAAKEEVCGVMHG